MWSFLIGRFVFLMCLTIDLILTYAWWLGAVTRQNSQKEVGNDRLQFTANNERAVQTLKPSAQKNEFLVIFCKFAHGFSSAFQLLQMHCRIFCNLADSPVGFYRPKKIRKSWYLWPKKKPTAWWLFRSRHFRKTKETKVI